MGRLGWDEGAHLGHEDNEGHLAHIGGLARHVRAGNDGAHILAAVHVGIVGDKEGIFQHLFHHGVAALHNGQRVGGVHLRHTVAVGGGHSSEGVEHVHLGHGGGGLLHPVDLGAHGLL